MNLLEIKQRLDSVPQPDFRAALADFEAHLIALNRRQKFTICTPRTVNDLPSTSAARPKPYISAKNHSLTS